jgi:lysophospholipase L1-like esterase
VLLALLCAAVSACGSSSPDSPTGPSPAPSNEVFFTAVGASDAIGYGSSSVCIPFTQCPNGQGYVQRIARRLQAEGKQVTLSNLGIPGAVLSPTIQSLGNQVGLDILANFLEREMPFVSRDSTVVTIFAGGNDANAIGRALERGLGGSNPSNFLSSQIQGFGADMRALVNGIRDRAPQARIVILNLPNLAAMPYMAGESADRKRVFQQIAVGLSAQINALAASNVIVVDLMCDGNFLHPSIFSPDGFHPNDAGYGYMADVVYPAVLNGTFSLPSNSCSYMSLY